MEISENILLPDLFKLAYNKISPIFWWMYNLLPFKQCSSTVLYFQGHIWKYIYKGSTWKKWINTFGFSSNVVSVHNLVTLLDSFSDCKVPFSSGGPTGGWEEQSPGRTLMSSRAMAPHGVIPLWYTNTNYDKKESLSSDIRKIPNHINTLQ